MARSSASLPGGPTSSSPPFSCPPAVARPLGRRTLLACVAWLGLVGAGFGQLWSYGLSAPATGPSPVAWPATSELGPCGPLGRLLVVLHPRCPCSRATLRQLERLQARLPDIERTPAVEFLFVRPPGAPPGWEVGELWDAAGRLPGALRHVDPDGALALRLGAGASGHALVYDGAGHLRFSGGITPARAHEGSCAGAEALLAAWSRAGVEGEGRPAPAAAHLTFGCPLSEERP